MRTENWLPLLGLLLISCGGCAEADPATRAEALARSGDYKQAIELYDRVASTTKDPSIFGNRGNCHSYLGNLDAALADYETALKLIAARSGQGDDPILPMIYYNRGRAFEMAYKYQPAIQDYEKTISLSAEYPDVKNNLAWVLATCPEAEFRNGKRAVELAENELVKSPDNANVLDTLAAAYAAAGDFARATTTQEKAISRCLPEQKEGFSARLELYRSKQMYVDSPRKP